jgi:hypothetical protein
MVVNLFNVMDANLLHPSKQLAPDIVVTSGNEADVILLHP